MLFYTVVICVLCTREITIKAKKSYNSLFYFLVSIILPEWGFTLILFLIKLNKNKIIRLSLFG